MTSASYRKKISASLDVMNEKELKMAWLILKEIISEKKPPVVGNKKELDKKLLEAMRQMENGEGTDFGEFITEMKKKYGKSRA